jgi:hypothetical protein
MTGDALVLIDEADVFLEARNSTEIARNALGKKTTLDYGRKDGDSRSDLIRLHSISFQLTHSLAPLYLDHLIFPNILFRLKFVSC